jgi:hypothetical protein
MTFLSSSSGVEFSLIDGHDRNWDLCPAERFAGGESALASYQRAVLADNDGMKKATIVSDRAGECIDVAKCGAARRF